MDKTRISGSIRDYAGPTLLLRAAIVGSNFAVMMGLAWGLGLAEFGELMVLWGLSVMLGTVVSAGAPVLLLRLFSDGSGMHRAGMIRQAVLYPIVLAVGAAFVLPLAFSGIPWRVVIGAGLALNAVACLAGVMRALGSLQWSMAIRDAGPQLALGAAWFVATGTEAILTVATCFMAGLIVVALLWCRAHPQLRNCLRPDGDRGKLRPTLWANSVLGAATAQIDIVLGGSFLSSDQIGLYALVRRVANLVALPVSVATWASATPIAAAHGAGDLSALRRASLAGSKIAFLPGCVLAAIVAVGLISWNGEPKIVIAAICAVMLQVVMASSLTVANLCGQEHLALAARLGQLAIYFICAVLGGLAVSAAGNAVAYLAGVACGGVWLWWILLRRMGVDTSAFALVPTVRGRTWTLP